MRLSLATADTKQKTKPQELLVHFWACFVYCAHWVFWINLFDKLFRQLIHPQITNQHLGFICFYGYNQNPFLGRTIIKNSHRRFQVICNQHFYSGVTIRRSKISPTCPKMIQPNPTNRRILERGKITELGRFHLLKYFKN